MRILIFMLALAAGSLGFQKKTNIDFVGTWKVLEVKVDESSRMTANPAVLTMVKNSMARVVFNFKADHHIQMSGADTRQQPDGEWSYDATYKLLQIKSGSGADRHTLYMVVSKNDKGQVFFKMQNAPVTLRVSKL